jgi:hypothetical protein
MMNMKTVRLNVEIELLDPDFDHAVASIMVMRQLENVLNEYMDLAMEDETCGGVGSMHVSLHQPTSPDDILQAIRTASLRGTRHPVITTALMRKFLDRSSKYVATTLAEELQFADKGKLEQLNKKS